MVDTWGCMCWVGFACMLVVAAGCLGDACEWPEGKVLSFAGVARRLVERDVWRVLGAGPGQNAVCNMCLGRTAGSPAHSRSGKSARRS